MPPDGSKNLTLEKITHVVAPGENIYTIANRYGVTPKDIRKWNGLGSNRVAKGKRLRLYVDNGGVAFASASTKTTAKPAERSSTASASAKKITQPHLPRTRKALCLTRYDPEIPCILSRKSIRGLVRRLYRKRMVCPVLIYVRVRY